MPYRHKAIFCFQKIDGVDVCFWGMHLHEYGSDCPQPNKNRVYIAYLDSVKFFQPAELRTRAYMELLIAYLQWCKDRGFVYAHIWACPPLPGDDYIFWAHPEEQKVPQQKRLRDWYRNMLSLAKSEGTVVEYRDIMQQRDADDLTTARHLPFFEGDYWSDEIERQVQKLNEEAAAEEEEGDEDDQASDQPAESGTEPLDAAAKKSSKKTSKKSSKKNAKKKGGKRPGLQRQCTQLASALIDQMQRLRDTFFVVQLVDDPAKGVCGSHRPRC